LGSVPRQSFTRQPLHERIQQFLGAEDSQLQTEAGVRRHLTLVFVVDSLLKSRDSESTHRGSANGRVPKRVAHVWSTLSPHPVGGVFHDLIQTIARWLKENQMTPSQVFEILFNRLLYV